MKNVLIATNCGKYVLIGANLIKKNLSRSTFAFEKFLNLFYKFVHSRLFSSILNYSQ